MSADTAHVWSGPEVRDLVLQAVRRLWEDGYQPADVLRVARRRLGEPDANLLRRVLAAELVMYPRGTVDRRWLGQVSDPEAAPGGPSSAVPWAVVARRREVLVPLLAGLPRLERPGPLPGSVPEADDVAAPSVDARVLERVRALLAKAESTTFPEEAETFTAGSTLPARDRLGSPATTPPGRGRRVPP